MIIILLKYRKSIDILCKMSYNNLYIVVEGMVWKMESLKKKRKYSYRIGRIAALVLSAAIFLCGCDKNDISETSESTSETESTSGKLGEWVISGEDDTLSAYPVTVNDVEITASPQQVICLSSSLTEIVCELGYGERLTGRGSYCEYPESVSALPDFGRPAYPDLDAIIRSSPDLLLTATSIPNIDIVKLNDSGIKVLYIPAPRSLDEFGRIYSALGIVFEGIFDGEDDGNKIYTDIRNKLTGSGITVGSFVYVTEGGAVAGGDTIESSVLSLFGTNLAKDASGYCYAADVLGEEQPDVVIINSDVSSDIITGDEKLGTLDAVQSGKLISISNSYFESPSGRIIGILDELS